MDCGHVQERLRDLARGRLEGTEAAEVRRHLAGCGACRHEVQAERLLDEALARGLERPHAPAALRERVARAVAAAGAPAAGGAPRREGAVRRWSRGAAAAAALAFALAGGGFVAGRVVQDGALATDRLADELVSDHLRALASTHPHDVETSDAHQVKPWFEGRLDFAPVVPGDRGELRLLGGAVGYVEARKAAVLSYALRRHRLSLLAFPREALAPLGAAGPAAAPRRFARRGFEVAAWAAGDVGYALVGDVPGEELGRLADELAAETRR